jgi:S-formylglutathione hydrolase FrmB
MRASFKAASTLAFLLSAAPLAGELRSESFRSPSLGTDVTVAIHLPPSYAAGRGDFPAVYALHGLFEGAGFWERRGLRAQLDALWAAKALPEFVVVAVDGGNSFFVNGPLGRYEDLVLDAVAWAEGHLRLRRGREQRGLWGVSMGGYAGLRLALQRPREFAAVVTHSAMLLEHPPTRQEGAGRWHLDAFRRAFGDPIDTRLWSASDPLALAQSVPASELPALRFDCGADDRYGLHGGNRKLHELLLRRGAVHEFELPPGDHGYDYVRGVFERGLRFLASRWAAR